MKTLTLCLLIVLAFFLIPVSASSQTASAPDGQLNAEYKGKVVLLRGFYSGEQFEFDENGTVSAGATTGSWTLANIEITSVRTTPQAIEIAGERLGSWFTGGKTRMMKAGKITIRVARPTTVADPLSTARQLLTRIFIEPDEDICPTLTEEWRVYCAGTDPQARERAWSSIVAKSHLTPYNSEMRPAGVTKANVTAPVAQHAPDPRYTKAARKHHIEGTVVLKLVVDAAGRPNAVSVVRPLGMGLDEEAVRSVRQWTFRPAMQNGRAVSVQINVEVEFVPDQI